MAVKDPVQTRVRPNFGWAKLRVLFAALLTSALTIVGISPANAEDPSDNPPWPAVGCGAGLNVAIMMDLSGSMSGYVNEAKTSIGAMVDDLATFPINFAVNSFDSVSPSGTMNGKRLPLTPVNAVLKNDKGQPVDAAGNPTTDPAKQVNVIKDHISHWSAGGGTNWQAGLEEVKKNAAAEANVSHYDAVLFITDGAPAGGQEGVAASKVLKKDGTRIVAVALTNSTAKFEGTAKLISGPLSDKAASDATQADYFISEFSKVGETIKNLLIDVCGAISVEKTAELNVGANGKADETITYKYVVKNDGNKELSNVTLRDPWLASAKVKPNVVTDVTFASGFAGTLAPGATATATAVYQVTDADRGAEIVNSDKAVATANDVKKPGESNPVSVKLPGAKIAMTDTSKLDEAKPGDTINYSFTVKNTGAQTLYGVAVDAETSGLTNVQFVWPKNGKAGELAANEVATVSGEYKLTQADVDAGQVAKDVTAIGNPPIGPAVNSAAANATPVQVERRAEIKLTKAAELDQKDGNVAGDVVTYKFQATNTGTVTLAGVQIVDNLAGLSQISYQWPGEAGVLAPGQHVQATATYKLTKADLQAGKLENSASVSGKTPSGMKPESVQAADKATLTLVARPTPKNMPKTGVDADGVAAAGLAIVTILAAAGGLVASRKKRQ